MFGRNKPEAVKDLGGRPIDWAELEDGRWVAAFDGELVLTAQAVESSDAGEKAAGAQTERHPWAEFENASWSEGDRRILVTYVDGKQPLVLRFADGESQKIAYVIRERLQRSIVFQEAMDLPSGSVARGMVRRSGDESLFTQVIIDGQTGPEDADTLAVLEASLRDVTGISDN
ncbi:MAG: hypothetical protein ACTHW1_04975 [Ancrocorticia sp.]|uniref:hypothetical protein n=1 Tax=Ancrocorticia sp. TaxID=2593684 RepID=UPI003F8F9D0E